MAGSGADLCAALLGQGPSYVIRVGEKPDSKPRTHHRSQVYILDDALQESLSEVVRHLAADFDAVEATLTAQCSAVSNPAGLLPPAWASWGEGEEDAAPLTAPWLPQVMPAPDSTLGDWEDLFLYDGDDASDEADG